MMMHSCRWCNCWKRHHWQWLQTLKDAALPAGTLSAWGMSLHS
jgi:hypothetical protein